MVHYQVLPLTHMKMKLIISHLIVQIKRLTTILLDLIRNENILVTPHIAFFSDEAVQNLVEGGLNAALSVINTGTCDTRLN